MGRLFGQEALLEDCVCDAVELWDRRRPVVLRLRISGRVVQDREDLDQVSFPGLSLLVDRVDVAAI
jgi:ABC-type taurine transport system substrate-binding protein